MIRASDEFTDKTVRVNEMWQTDFTYFKILCWGWYYLSSVLDDYSRYIVHWQLCKSMESKDVEETPNRAMVKSKLKPTYKPRFLSNNSSCYIAKDLKPICSRKTYNTSGVALSRIELLMGLERVSILPRVPDFY